MKKVDSCTTENCIATLSSCVEWNGGDIDFLGLCDGASLNDVIAELTGKVESISGDSLTGFDIDGLLDICGVKAPINISPLTIFNVIKANEICLKDSINNISEQLADIQNDNTPDVNLKCFNTVDNLGNSLVITRDGFDQLVIDNLCSHKSRLDDVESDLVVLQSQINNIDLTTTVDELSFGTCLDGNILPTSTQVINLSEAFCALQVATGGPADIAAALAIGLIDLPTEVTTNPDYVASIENWSEQYNNLLIAFNNLQSRVTTMELTCCAVSCDDVKIGFSAVFTDATTLTLRFTAGAGTLIPGGWSDNGSTVTITDVDGETVTEIIPIDNNSEHDISILGLSLAGDLQITVTAKMTNGSISCERCLGKTITTTGACDYCEICVTGTSGTITILYDDGNKFVGTSFNPTTSTTTTTTEAEI